MKSFTCGMAGGLVIALGLAAAPGCGPDNETEAKKLSGAMGDPGTPENKNKNLVAPPPATGKGAYNQRERDPGKVAREQGYSTGKK